MSADLRERLLATWLRTAADAGARGDLAAVGVRLLAAYAEPHRRYHDVHHLDAVLGHIDQLSVHALDLGVLRLAAWFHDAVYEPAAADNEERSAELAQRELYQLGLPTAAVAEVCRLVRLTASHDPAPDDADGAVLCDADLAVLAEGPDRYARYVSGVRAEYAAVPQERFAAGRAAVLRALLARPALFATRTGQQRWETRARANVSAELVRLAGGAGAGPPPGA